MFLFNDFTLNSIHWVSYTFIIQQNVFIFITTLLNISTVLIYFKKPKLSWKSYIMKIQTLVSQKKLLLLPLLTMMMTMMNFFCGMVGRGKAFSLICSQHHCQRSSPLRISDTPRVGFEPTQSLSSDLFEWSCAIAINTAPRRHIVFLQWLNGMKIQSFA